MTERNDNNNSTGTQGGAKKKYDPKDPLRPRRKKARRACYACQRAHLTCGDERPCQRCIKRGLADACQDGVRKKAKYLHDAPPEALRPVLGPNYNPEPTPTTRSNGQRHPSGASETLSTAGSTYFPQNSTASYPVYSGSQTPVGMPESISFQPSPVSPSFPQNNNNAPRAGSVPGLMSPQMTNDAINFSTLFDPSNPALFNFDLEGLNFGSQYGALEFGMLGHMSSGAGAGAGETPPQDHGLSGPSSGDVNFGSTGVFGNGNRQQFGQFYDNGMVNDLIKLDPSPSGMYQQGNLHHALPQAYAIAAGPNSLHSPSTENTASPQPANFTYDGSPVGHYSSLVGTPNTVPSVNPRPKPKAGVSQKGGASLGKRQRDASWIYESVKEPYQYLAGFHALIAFLQKRFSANKTLRIVKALASIRPSFISCMKTLDHRDLIFMEKCFQRTLLEYEDRMHQCPAPTILCRRTGEIAAVNKEFVALTGWTKAVLLGNEPNRNVNTGGAPSGPGSGPPTGRAGLATPKLSAAATAAAVPPGQSQGEGRRKQPVFIAEILDDDSVIEFYEDFAQLAFGDSRGTVYRSCKVLKYRTDESAESTVPPETTPQRDPRKSILSHRVTRIDGEHGISTIEKDGKVECRYCWTIKRDVFDIPMLIVINVRLNPTTHSRPSGT
ncbi:hypothetical protein ACRALDRAFT_1081954 [Sodiomyces alcalophilus JCM 7366]|uniref:uncharacterized protein n=1 Tax=Sodiomyces alcalophilus JCM 7366 TaxID=591952 RepID=UPI0039B58FB7